MFVLNQSALGLV